MNQLEVGGHESSTIIPSEGTADVLPMIWENLGNELLMKQKKGPTLENSATPGDLNAVVIDLSTIVATKEQTEKFNGKLGSGCNLEKHLKEINESEKIYSAKFHGNQGTMILK